MKTARSIGLFWLAATVTGVGMWQCLPRACAQASDGSMGDQAALPSAQSTQASSQLEPSSPKSDQLLDRDHARQYMLELINRDRKSVGAAPVLMDETATRAGDIHSDEMAEFGYLAHWTMDGRKPDQRYTECGGKDNVAENVDAMNTPNPEKLALCQKQLFTKKDLEEVEGQFFNEKPPNDGHRVNIIDRNHTAVGIGLSVAGTEPGAEDGFPRMACTQEFVNHYGTYGDIAQAVAPGDPVVVEGTIDKGMHFDCIDIRWEKFPEPMTIEELDKTYSYSIPDEVVSSYFPPPFESPAPVNVTEHAGCEHFSVEIPTNKQWKAGLYYLTIWAKMKDKKEAYQISTRTFKYGAGGKKATRLERH